MKVKGGRKRFAIFILIMWIPFLPFIILDKELLMETKIFILVTNLIGWSLFIFVFIEKEPLKGNEAGERVMRFLENQKLILISFITAVIATVVLSFYELIFIIIFLYIFTISFAGVILSNLFFPLEYVFSVFSILKNNFSKFPKNITYLIHFISHISIISI